jgi:NAD-dependent aldehyde dehydrogenases
VADFKRFRSKNEVKGVLAMKMIIGGQWVDSDNGERIPVHDPQDGSIINEVPAATSDDVRRAFDMAEKGARVMRELSSYERYRILKKAAEMVDSRLEELSQLIAREGIKTIREARKEVARAANTLIYAAEEAKRISGELIHFDADFRSDRRIGYWLREPVGIVLAITPYNDPLNMIAHKVGPAIAAGNAVVLKPTYLTPLSALKMGEILLNAGLPEEAISIITGKSSAIGDALVTDSRPRVITFTGGTHAGLEITRKAGIKKLVMELGASSPVIVMDDALFEKAVEDTVSGAFWAAGQNCIGVQRVYVHETIYDRFVEEMVEQTKAYRIGDKLDEMTDMGPMIDGAETNRVESWVEEAIAMGAKALTGHKRQNNFYWPTILVDVPENAKVVRNEVFGPVVSVFKIGSLDEAITKSNDTEYGLHAAIFTRDLNRAFKAARELRFGGVFINDSTDFRVDYMPFGGCKMSGIGREGLKFAIDAMTEIKVVGCIV